ncbi:MAG TPA: hypothetical protein VKT29_16630, partial [Terriglobales bacterium]|nr:hypothetical protein [Terriglobales bacterium]
MHPHALVGFLHPGHGVGFQTQLFSDKGLNEHLGSGPFVFLGWKHEISWMPGCRQILTDCNFKHSKGFNPNYTFRRRTLFDLLEYGLIPERIPYPGQFPKWPAHLTCSVFEKVQMSRSQPMAACVSKQATKSFIFYQEATQYWVKATVGL